MTQIELDDVVALIEEAHTAKTAQSLRQAMVYGVGSLIPSESCAWTELNADAYKSKLATISTVDVNDVPYDVPASIALLTQYAWQHPVVKHIVLTGEVNAVAISELKDRAAFQSQELYQLFYKTVSVEDQLIVGYVENGIAKGLSVNRSTWGFTDDERRTLTRIANSILPYYRSLSRLEAIDSQPHTLIEASINNLSMHSKTLGVTTREAELLMHVAFGLSNKQIAATCEISEGTVRKHLENTFRKLGVTNRVSAVIRAADIIRSICI